MTKGSEFQGKVALVTGASGGVGSTIATALAAEGATLALAYGSRPEPAERLAAAITNRGACAIAARQALPGMIDRGFGRILFMSSVAAFTGGIVGPHYAASKAGLHGLTQYLASRTRIARRDRQCDRPRADSGYRHLVTRRMRLLSDPPHRSDPRDQARLQGRGEHRRRPARVERRADRAAEQPHPGRRRAPRRGANGHH